MQLDPCKKYTLSPEWIVGENDGNPYVYQLNLFSENWSYISALSAQILSLISGGASILYVARRLAEHSQTMTVDAAFKLCVNKINELNVIGDIVIPSRDQQVTPVSLRDYSCHLSAIKITPSTRFSKPVRCMLIPTNKCTTNCIYCYAERSNIDDLSIKNWKSIIKKIAKSGIKMVDISGGDPFAREDIVDILSCLIEYDILFGVSTKSHISKEKVNTLASLRYNKTSQGLVRPFQISIDSVDSCTSFKMTGQQSFLCGALDSVSNLLHVDIPVRVKTVLTPLNKGEIRNIISSLVGLGVKEFSFTKYFLSRYRPNGNLLIGVEDVNAIIQDLSMLRKEYPNIIIKDDVAASLFSNEYGSLSHCTIGERAFVVCANGNITLCEQMPNREPFVVGNILVQDIQSFWNSEIIERFVYPKQNQFTGTECEKCALIDLCISSKLLCARDSYFECGKIHAPHANCIRAKAS